MRRGVVLCMKTLLVLAVVPGAALEAQQVKEKRPLSFKNDVFPVIKRACLPCHAEDNFNPSGLSLDSYDLLMEGGKHGAAVIPGNPGKSAFIQKLLLNPPFGDRMPLDRKRKSGEPSTKTLSAEEVQMLADWVGQGAKNN
jgi:hypothetical protein